VLFFDKTSATKKVWYYQLNLTRNLGKTNPLNESDLAEFLRLQKTKGESENSWSVDVKNLDKKTFDLSVKNPNKSGEVEMRSPEEIFRGMKKMDEEGAEILEKIKKFL
jgi:type I restriction enzyme M protein